MSTYNFSTYNSLIYDIQDEVNNAEFENLISPESIKGFILQGCQRICSLYPVPKKYDLRLVTEQTQYFFADATLPVDGSGTVNVSANTVVGVTSAGTGTISTSGINITGSGTSFVSQLQIGKAIIVGSQIKIVSSITSNTSCTINSSFDSDLTASSFNYSTTRFTKEVNVGSTIVVGGISKIVDTITDPYNLTVITPYSATQSAQSFTIDTSVSEIPTEFYNVYELDRMEGNIPVKIPVTSNENLLKKRQRDFGINAYSNYSQPTIASVWSNNIGRKYLEIYPSVQTDKTVSIYGYIQVNPRFYVDNSLDDNIPLTQEFEPAIKEFAKYRIYKRIKDDKSAVESLQVFDMYIRSLINNMPTKKTMQITYR